MLKKSKRKSTHVQIEAQKTDDCCCFFSECEDKKRRKRLSCFILALALLLIVGPGYFFFFQRFSQSHQIPNEADIRAEQEVMTLASVIYRHFNGYEAYCAKNGYQMQVYPKAFAHVFQKQMQVLDAKAKEQGTSLAGLLNQINKQFGPAFDRLIHTELQQMQKDILAQKGEGSAPQTVAVIDFCQMIDEQSEQILADPANEDFILIRQTADALTGVEPN